MTSVSPRFRKVIEERTGLDLARRDEEWLVALVMGLVGETNSASVEHLVDRLDAEALTSPLWALTVERLTISETYFFRDLGQMELLRHQLLPRLCAQARGRPLQIWSAGCSTGEEVYSLAMLADSINVRAELLGTDLNPEVLEVARAGRYRERALRSLPDEFRRRYLLSHGDEHEVLPRLRDRARFSVHNLCDKMHSFGQFDLVVCRNVLIYFARESLSSVFDIFHSSLRPGGMLLTGHGELMGLPSPFEVMHFPQSMVYLKAGLDAAPRLAVTPTTRLRDMALPCMGVTELSEPSEPEVESLCREGRQARLAGERERASALFRQALYLDPEHIPVFLEKSLLWFDEDPERARKDYSTALALLASKPRERRLIDDVALPLAELQRRDL